MNSSLFYQNSVVLVFSGCIKSYTFSGTIFSYCSFLLHWVKPWGHQVYTFGDCISYFSNCWDQIHDKRQIEEMQIFHGLQVRGYGSSWVGKWGCWWRWSTVREQREMNVDPLLPLPFSSDWEPSSRNVPTVPVSFLTVVSPVKKVLPRHAQMFIS